VKFIKTIAKIIVTATLSLISVIVVSALIKLTIDSVEILENIGSPRISRIKPLPVFKMSEMGKTTGLPFMIALYHADKAGDWRYQCTAFVVTNKYAITAAHCVTDENGSIERSLLQVRSLDLKTPLTYVRAASMNSRADLAVVTGDFSKFQHAMINRDGYFGSVGPYTTCGFPWGDTPPICTPFVPSANFYFGIQGSGALFPGMSGGPVVDLGSGKIIGLNQLVQNGVVVIAPLTGIFGALELPIQE
jgi:Trypsin-like peptidase domain